MTRRAWTPEEVATLHRLYADTTSAVLSKMLGRKPSSINAKANLLRLFKSEAFKASVQSGRIQRGKQLPSMTTNHFRPGHQPWNKGTQYQAGGRSVETRFHKGNKPHTWQPVGTYRVVTDKNHDKHLERKMTEISGPNHLRWVPVARLVWMENHGPVPAKHIVVFKPGMKTVVLEEITIDRLECITRAENAHRNHPRNKHPELAKLVQLKGAITRQVNRIAREEKENA